MRIVVTGASGQIGRALLRSLLELGHTVVGLSRHPVRDLEGVDWLVADIADWPAMQCAMAQLYCCDAVVHAAAQIKAGAGMLEGTRINALGTAHVLEAAKRWRASHFTYISSLSVLGWPQQDPVVEHHPIGPTTAYGHAKYFGEGLVRLADSPSMRTCALRISSPIGLGTPAQRIFSTFVRRAMRGEPLVLNGRGTRRQDYVDVRDIARAVLLATEVHASGLFQIGSGVSVSNEELARRCVATLESSAQVTFSGLPDPDDELRWNLSIEHAAAVLGYAPLYSLSSSIESYADSCHFD